MAVRVRPARPSDQPRLVEIASHSATAAQWNQAEYLKLFSIDEPEAQTPAETVTKPQLHSRTALVVEQDGNVVGFIVGRWVNCWIWPGVTAERAFFLKYGSQTARPGLFMRNGLLLRLDAEKRTIKTRQRMPWFCNLNFLKKANFD
jgi:hypothetical protein